MNLDEVVAANVRRIREDQKLSVADLADRLHVGRHIVYDYERPRPGAGQRQFLWSDLVKLCDALKVTLYELVLPPAGETVTSGTIGLSALARTARDQDSRTRLGWMLFGLNVGEAESKTLSKLAAYWMQEYDKTQEAMLEPLRDFVDRLIDQGYWSDEELREAGYVKEEE